MMMNEFEKHQFRFTVSATVTRFEYQK